MSGERKKAGELMARYRAVHCLIWNDDKFPYASDDCQLVFFHVMTTPLSTPFGLYKASLEMLASEKRWPVKRYKKAFQEGYAKGFFKYDEKALVLLIPNFLKYNPPNNPKVLQSWGKVCEEIPNCSLKAEFFSILKGYLEGYGKAFQDAMPKAIAKLSGTGTGTGTVKKGGSGGAKEEGPEGKNDISALPDWLDPELWKDFREHRRKLRKPMSRRAEELNLKELTRLKESGQDPKSVVEVSIAKGWQSFYPLDGKDAGGRVGSTKADQIRRQTAETLKRGMG